MQWIKVQTDIFDNPKMRAIMAESEKKALLWLRLLTTAGQMESGGRFEFRSGKPYSTHMLACSLGVPQEVLEDALETFLDYEMVEYDGETLVLSGWEEYQNTEAEDRKRELHRARQQRYREKRDAGEKSTEESPERQQNVNVASPERHSDVTVTQDVTRCDALEEDIEKEYKLTVSDETVRRTPATDVQKVVNAWNAIGHGVCPVKTIRPGTTRYKMLSARLQQYGVDAVLEAIAQIPKSPHLLGGGSRGWMITFDWFVRPNNFPKVLDGNYIGAQTRSKKQTTFHNFEQRDTAGGSWDELKKFGEKDEPPKPAVETDEEWRALLAKTRTGRRA